MLTKVNVEICEVVTVNICYVTACLSMGGCRGGLLLGLYSRTFSEETLRCKTWILICRLIPYLKS